MGDEGGSVLQDDTDDAAKVEKYGRKGREGDLLLAWWRVGGRGVEFRSLCHARLRRGDDCRCLDDLRTHRTTHRRREEHRRARGEPDKLGERRVRGDRTVRGERYTRLGVLERCVFVRRHERITDAENVDLERSTRQGR